MKIVLITQDDPFYLAKNFDYLATLLKGKVEIVACVLFDVAPFGKKQSIFEQAKDTYKVFGWKFFLNYGFKYVLNKLDKNTKIVNILSKHNILLIRLEKKINHPESLKIIKAYKPDLLVSIAGNQIFKKPLFSLAPKGCINLHTALLPKYRGLMPTFWVLRHNEKETGVSVFFVDEGIDSGPIIVQKRVTIGDMTQQQLIEHTKKLGMEAVAEAILKIKDNKVQLIPNPVEEMTYFTKPTKEDVQAFLAAGKRFF